MSLESVKRNGHNLDLGQFELAGEYGIPQLQPVHFPLQVPLSGQPMHFFPLFLAL